MNTIFVLDSCKVVVLLQPATSRSKGIIPALLLGVVIGMVIGACAAAKLGWQCGCGCDVRGEQAKAKCKEAIARHEGTDAEKIAAKALAKSREEESAYALCEAMAVSANNKEVVQAAAKALRQVRPDLYKYAVVFAVGQPRELLALADEVKEMKRGARPLAPLMRAALQRCLDSKTVNVRGLVKALGAVSPDDGETVAMMVKLISSDPNSSSGYFHYIAQVAAVEVLGEIVDDFPSKGRALLPVLVKALENRMIREHVCKAIGKLGPDGKDAVPALNRYRLDQNERVRQSVAEAMRRIGGKKEEE
jgi:hypothetical protein